MSLQAEIVDGRVNIYRWDVGTLSFIPWDGSLTVGSLTIGAVTQSGVWTVTATGPLTDAQLRAAAVPVSGTFFQATQPVSGPLTDAQLRAVAVPVSGTVTASGPLTDAQLRAAPVPISGTVTATPTGTQNVDVTANTIGLATQATLALLLSRADTFKTRSDTYTTTANGVTVDASTSPLSAFGIQVKATGVVTSWDTRVEGSLNNVDFTTILTHTNVTGDGVVLWTGTLEAPTLYLRSRCAGLVLGGGTNVVVTIIGQN